MSLVYITNHSETVFDWENEEIQQFRKPKMYRSRYRQKITCLAQKEQTKTDQKFQTKRPGAWGYAETPLRNTNEFLRKNEGIRLQKDPLHKCVCLERKPQLPTLSSQVQNPKNKIKNFKIENIKKVASTTSRKTKPKYTDTRVGDTHEYHKSGIIPQYVYNRNYGRVPVYIIKRTHFLKNYHERDEPIECENKMNEIGERRSHLKFISPEERLEILNGLKKNWEELHKIYLGLPIFTDTLHKKQRKTKIEEDLRKLEKDILLIEANPVICVCDDD